MACFGSFAKTKYTRDINTEDITEILDILRHGLPMKKIQHAERSKTFKKQVVLDEDKRAFRYFPTKKGKDFKISITNIVELNRQIKTSEKATFDNTNNNILNNQQLVVVYTNGNGDHRKLELITEDPGVAKIWHLGLSHLRKISHRWSEDTDPLHEAWLREAFNTVDVDNNGALCLKECTQLLKLLNASVAERTVQTIFDECNIEGCMGKESKLTREEFAVFFDRLYAPYCGLTSVIQRYSGFNNKITNSKTGALNPESLRQFFKQEQSEELSIEECKKLIFKYENHTSDYELTPTGFAHLLLSEENSIRDPIHNNIHQDMTLPLHNYYINSSHNTYLLEDQLKGPSSTDAYLHALNKGCKTLELDCWNGENNEPIVYHGHTLTSKIYFKDVIQAINQQPFPRSNYPLILSFENHCSPDQQKVMVHHLTTILKDKLLVEERDPDRMRLPSPKSLRGKILIKGKKLPDDCVESAYISEDDDEAKAVMESGGLESQDSFSDQRKSSQVSSTSDCTNETQTNDIDTKSREIDHKWSEIDRKSNELDYKLIENDSTMLIAKSSNKSMRNDKNDGMSRPSTLTSRSSSFLSVEDNCKRKTSTEGNGNNNGTTTRKKNRKTNKKGKLKLAKEFSDLVNYVQSVAFRSIEENTRSNSYYMMSSLNETKFISLAKNSARELVNFHTRFLTRVYPGSMRWDSSNYNPVLPWTYGCQIVALNFQTQCEMMDFNNGMFSLNGGCGYVLKPKCIREGKIDPLHNGPYPGIDSCVVYIRIISGHLLPKAIAKITSIPDPYVKIDIHGIPQDEILGKLKTKTVKKNGLHPVWNAVFEFRLNAPELAHVRLCVFDEETGLDDFIGQYSIPIHACRTGFRRVPLLDKFGQQIEHASILVELRKQIFNNDGI